MDITAYTFLVRHMPWRTVPSRTIIDDRDRIKGGCRQSPDQRALIPHENG
jgi:hypothetical protein